MKNKKILLFFKQKSLTNQIVIIIAAIMIVPLVALIYDIFFASQTERVIFLEKEQRLKALVQSTNEEFTKRLESLGVSPGDISSTVLHNEFTQVVEPHVPANSGIRFGLYVPRTEKISVLGFLHNYRNLSPAEEAKREKEIFANTKPGLIAAEMSRESSFRISGSWDDQVLEYISPVTLEGKVVAVMWAGDRLNPFFSQSILARKLLRYFTLAVLALVMVATLLTIRNVTTGVNRLKQGLQQMEGDIHRLLPDMSGELGQIAQAVNRMARGLVEKERLEDQLRHSEQFIALGRLATGVAQEFRNPIGIIKTIVELMKQDYSQVSGIDEFTKAIDEQVDRQNMVIQELLDFGRPTTVSVKECSVNQLIKGVLSFSAAMLRKQHVRVRLQLDNALPLILGDTEKLKQIFVNLIVNAAEAMPFGGELVIKTATLKDAVTIAFTDTGTGISKEEKSKIFNPYYTTKKTGTGLGLSISLQSIMLHGGKIEVESVPGEGSTFTVQLPIAQGSKDRSDNIDTTDTGD